MSNERGMKVAAWVSLVLAVACWPLALSTFGLIMGEKFGQTEEARHWVELQRVWAPILSGLLLFSFLASVWLSGLSIRQARVVAGLAVAIDALAMAGVTWSTFVP